MSTENDDFPVVPPISDLYVLSAAAVDEESERVLDELIEFHEHLLPAMAAHEPDRFPAGAADVGPPTLRAWKAGTMRLLGLLNTIDTTDGPPVFDRDEFSELLGPSPEPGFDFEVKDDRVRWMLSWSWGLCWQHVARFTNALPEEHKPSGPDDVERSMESAEQWMLGCSVRDAKLLRALYEALPRLADHRPGFAEAILDVENWRERILSNQCLTVTDRDKELARLDGQFRAILHQALHHVIWALANNHFMAIRPYLEHPEYQGPTSWETPYRLFEILMAKVEMLMDVRRQVRERDGTKPLTIVRDESISEKPAPPDWAHSDPRWREFTFLDYLADKPAEQFQWDLWQVLRPKFAPDQPKDYIEFSSCSAHLDLKVLDLDEDRQQKLLHGLAGRGARVPGTRFVLRVARPWYAHFEKQPGEFPALPDNWMEGLHLSKSGFDGMYEWIGRRHVWRENVVHWDRYQEMPSGWRLKSRSIDPLSSGRIRKETDRVASEIAEFRDHLLPAIAQCDPEIFTAHLQADPQPWTDRLRRLEEWQAAANRLLTFLPVDEEQASRVIDIAEFERFMGSKPSIAYTVDEDQIRWQISCYAELDWELVGRRSFPLPVECRIRGPEDSERALEATKRWILAGSTADDVLWNCADGRIALPDRSRSRLCKKDPGLRRLAVSHRIQLRTHRAAAQAQQLHRLTAPKPGGYFRLVVHNAILHVIGALANNRFMEIRPYVEHPEFVGRYTPLVPQYLFADLLAKVHTLQELSSNRRK